jgi:acyl-CoA dehydrogenase
MTSGGNHGGVAFETDTESRLILDSLREFLAEEVDHREDDLGVTWSNPRKRHEDDGRLVPEVLDAIREVRQASADAGFYAMNLPDPGADGDEGVSTVTWYRAKRLVAEHGRGLAEFVLAGPEGPKPLLERAEGAQAQRYLAPTKRAETTTAFALTEPGVGSDAPNMDTTARKEGDEWVLDGRKQWITNGPYADFVQVFARTTPQEEAGRYGGITCFIVEDGEFEVERLNNAVGMEGLQAELAFDGVRLGGARVLGTVDGAFYSAMEFLGLGRLELGATAVGYARHLLDEGEAYAGDREAFGRPIGTFQQVSSKLARGRARTQAADAQGLRAAWELDEGSQAIEETSAFKWFATNVLWDVADDVVGVHGASGVAEENEFMDTLELARVLRIVEGTDEIQLNTVASQRGLR